MKSILFLFFSLLNANALTLRFATKMDFPVTTIKAQRSQLERQLKEKLHRQNFLAHDVASRRAKVCSLLEHSYYVVTKCINRLLILTMSLCCVRWVLQGLVYNQKLPWYYQAKFNARSLRDFLGLSSTSRPGHYALFWKSVHWSTLNESFFIFFFENHSQY